jgi:hypothetical protein
MTEEVWNAFYLTLTPLEQAAIRKWFARGRLTKGQADAMQRVKRKIENDPQLLERRGRDGR